MPQDATSASEKPAVPLHKVLREQRRTIQSLVKQGRAGELNSDTISGFVRDSLIAIEEALETVSGDKVRVLPNGHREYLPQNHLWAQSIAGQCISVIGTISSYRHLRAGLFDKTHRSGVKVAALETSPLGQLIEHLLQPTGNDEISRNNHVIVIDLLDRIAGTEVTRGYRLPNGLHTNIARGFAAEAEQQSKPHEVWESIRRRLTDLLDREPAWKAGRLTAAKSQQWKAQRETNTELQIRQVSQQALDAETRGESPELVMAAFAKLKKLKADQEAAVVPSHSSGVRTVEPATERRKRPSQGDSVIYKGPVYGPLGVSQRIETYLNTPVTGLPDVVGLLASVQNRPLLYSGFDAHLPRIGRRFLKAIPAKPAIAGSFVEYLQSGPATIDSLPTHPKRWKQALAAMPDGPLAAVSSRLSRRTLLSDAIEIPLREAKVERLSITLKTTSYPETISILEGIDDSQIRRHVQTREVLERTVDDIFKGAAKAPVAFQHFRRLIPLAGGKIKIAGLTPERISAFGAYAAERGWEADLRLLERNLEGIPRLVSSLRDSIDRIERMKPVPGQPKPHLQPAKLKVAAQAIEIKQQPVTTSQRVKSVTKHTRKVWQAGFQPRVRREAPQPLA